MMESTHTPGPWKVGKVVSSGCDDRAFVLSEITGESITGWGCVTQKRADARLIAAAPDMYEELEHLATMTHKAFVSSEQVCFYIRKRVLPLLAKVRGE